MTPKTTIQHRTHESSPRIGDENGEGLNTGGENVL